MDSVTTHAQSAIPSPARLLRMWEREKGGKGKGSYRQKGSKQKRERRARTVEFIPQLINQGPGNALRAFCAMQKPSTIKAYVTAMDRGNKSQQKAVFYLERGLKELFTFSWSQPVYHPLMTYIVRLYTDITMETSVIVYLSQAFEPQHFYLQTEATYRSSTWAWDERERGGW